MIEVGKIFGVFFLIASIACTQSILAIHDDKEAVTINAESQSKEVWYKVWSKKACSLVPSTSNGTFLLGMMVALIAITVRQLMLESQDPAIAAAMCPQMRLDVAGDLCVCPLASATTHESFMSTLSKLGQNLMVRGRVCHEVISFMQGQDLALLSIKEGYCGWYDLAADTMARMCAVATGYTNSTLSQFVACMDPKKAVTAVQMVIDSGFNISSVNARNYIDYCRFVADAYSELP